MKDYVQSMTPDLHYAGIGGVRRRKNNQVKIEALNQSEKLQTVGSLEP
jgi:hypothetical protein